MSAVAPALREVVAELDDDEVLALCYGLGPRVERLQLYLEVLRGRPSERAQFAACLICFDLARRGDPALQAQFALLRQSLRQIEPEAAWLAQMLAQAPHLDDLWAAVQQTLTTEDPLAGVDAEVSEPLADSAAAQAQNPAAPLAAPSADGQAFGLDQELNHLRLEADDKALWRRYDEAVETFLGGVVGVPVYDQHAGFRLAQRRDVERVEAFIRQLDSLVHRIVPARGYRALSLLFLGSHLRSRALFGGLNARKQQLLREGLVAFCEPQSQVVRVAGVLSSMHADPSAWTTMAEVICAYLAWAAADPAHAAAGPRAFDAVGPPSAAPRPPVPAT